MFINERDIKINTYKALNLDSVLPNNKNIKFLNIEYDICSVNNIIVYQYGDYCDYCRSDIIRGWYCKKCFNKMCALCYIERTEEDAIKNGAKNYHLRKNKLLKCFKENKLVRYFSSINCNECEDDITGNCMFNIEENLDICMECYDENKHKNLTKYVNPSYILKINEWSILLEEKEGHCILYNICKDSEEYHKVAFMASDNHGRNGIFTTDDVLDEILEELKTYSNDEEENTWDRHFSTPICQAMQKRNMSIHYG